MPFPLETLEHLQGFFWIFIRVGMLIFLLPFFGARGIPVLWKIGASIILTGVLTPVVSTPDFLPEDPVSVGLCIASEAMLGFSMALGVKILLSAVQLAGQFLGFQMGFNMASVLDPQTGVQSSVISQFLYLLTVLFFFSVDGHHLFIRGVVASFNAVPPNRFQVSPNLCAVLVKASGTMFLIALKLASPVMIALFLSNLCLGIVARTVPQVNILMIGFPLNIGLGLIIFGVTLTVLSPFLADVVKRIGELLFRVPQLM
jgi:flagellar biosynthetic protein FliR